MEGLHSMSLGHVAAALNATTLEPYAALQHEAFVAGIAALAARFTNAALALLQALAQSCSLNSGRCAGLLPCFVPVLRDTLDLATVELQRTARGATAHLCRGSAPAALIALVAAVDSQASSYPSVTTECITLRSGLLDLRCGSFYDLGLQCVYRLFQARSLLAAAFRDLSRQDDQHRRLQWAFVRHLGRDRTDILAGLLSMLAQEGRELRAAEVGVFKAGTSSRLLDLFENLRILLVDPYHLHTENHTAEFQQLEEFYVSSKSTFLEASRATQRFRQRASFVLQSSGSLQWLRGDLDFVFLDGDHRYSSVRRDLKVFWPLLRPHGILAGHDFSPTFPGVVEATDLV
eukprot:s4576_g8.t1